MQIDGFDPADVARHAPAVAAILKSLGNERRLMILCELAQCGEASVNSLADAAGLSQSALSQHLGKLREAGLVGYRREAQTLWYFIADPRIERLMTHLYDLYCAPDSTEARAR